MLFFCSSRYDREALAAEMAAAFAGVPVVGCTTAGEIGPAGCREHSLAGVSFAASVCTPAIGRLEGLGAFRSADGVAVAQDLRRRLGDLVGGGEPNLFAFLLVDGLFGHEEQVAHALQEGLGDIPLVGGSAGDSLDFEGTYIYCDGRFSRDAAVLVLAATPLPITEFKTQHFTATDERLVVTEADPARRVWCARSTGCRRPRNTRACSASTPPSWARRTSPPRRWSSSSTGASTCAPSSASNRTGSSSTAPSTAAWSCASPGASTWSTTSRRPWPAPAPRSGLPSSC